MHKAIVICLLTYATCANAAMSEKSLTIAKGELAALRIETSLCVSNKDLAITMSEMGTDEQQKLQDAEQCFVGAKKKLGKVKDSLKRLVGSDSNSNGNLREWYTLYSSALERMRLSTGKVEESDRLLEAATSRFEASLEF